MRTIAALPGRVSIAALACAVLLPGADLAAQASVDQFALVAPNRAGVSYVPPSMESQATSLDVAPSVVMPASGRSTERSVLRGAAIGALVGAVGGVAMGAWVCNQGFGCSDRELGIAYWTLAGAGVGAVTGWVLHVVRPGD